MNYYKVGKHIICLDDVCSVEPKFPSDVIVRFRNGTSATIYFSDCGRRDEVIDELWQRLINMR